MKRQLLLFACILIQYVGLMAQKSANISLAQQYLSEHRNEWQWTASDVRDLIVNDNYVSEHSQVEHIYFLQQHNGIPLHNAVIAAHVKDGKVVYVTNNGVSNLAQHVNATVPALTPQAALSAFAKYAKQEVTERWILVESKNDKLFVFDKGTFAQGNIKVALCYQRDHFSDAIRLAWSVEAQPIHSNDLWTMRIDATTGELLERNSLTKHCQFHDHKADRVFEFYHNCIEEGAENVKNAQSPTNELILDHPATYKVFAFPVESPIHGQRTVVNDTSVYKKASPFGWHDTDGKVGAEYTITRGNNVHAYEDRNDTNKSNLNEPDAGSLLNFDFPYTATAEPNEIQDAAVTNLFYVNNFMHDFTFKYGFDEAAGNFQVKNYTGKGVGNDAVRAQAQDKANLPSSGDTRNNANFATPSDGGAPTMQMYEWTSSGRGLKINSPSTIAGTYENGSATFGPALSTTPVTGELVLAFDNSPTPTFACNTIVNAASVKGKIAVVDRGGCFFISKVFNAQKAGAIGVIIINFDPGTFNMSSGDENLTAQITIPSIMVSNATGNLLKNTMATSKVEGSLVLPPEAKPLSIDGDFDNGIIAHEYGHGISNRLTGGPSLANCLYENVSPDPDEVKTDQMGEGWSDFFSLVTTVKPTDKAAMQRGIGNFASRLAPDGTGIRSYPYSTDMKINPLTYSHTVGGNEYATGEFWTTTLWDLYWKMVEADGFDADAVNGKGGNNKCIQLVMDGMKLQPCNPGLIDGRNAIMKADEILYNGAHKCLIWDVFARRGVGVNASQGDKLYVGDQIENFESLPECQKTMKIIKTASSDEVKIDDVVTITLTVRNDTDADAPNTVVNDIVPTELGYVAGSASDGGTLNAGLMTFKLGTLAKGTKKDLTYKVKINSKASKALFIESFSGASSFSKSWETELIETDGSIFDVTQDLALDGTWSLAAPLDPAFAKVNKSNTLAFLTADKAVLVSGAQPVLRFYMNYSLQSGFDGILVDISKDGGNSWKDAGAQMFKNPYTGRLSYSTYSIPNAKSFWGKSKGWVPTYIDLKDYTGEKIQFRFRLITDAKGSRDNSETGVFIDKIEVMDMVNYNPEACVTADGAQKACATMNFRGIKVESKPLSAKDISRDLDATLFPNPSNDLLHLNLNSKVAGSTAITFFDINGRAVLQQNVNALAEAQVFSFDVQHLAKGLYTVKISQKDGFIVRKFVKI